ncbi:MAG: hypothetical protein AB8B55_21390 [Mariniblastus sp.]
MLLVKSISKTVLLAVACLALASNVSAQDQTRFVLKLDNDLISSFESYGSLRSAVPAEYKEKISFVELQFAETKGNEAIEIDLGLQINGENANIVLDDEALAAVKAQPVRVPVPADKNAFSQIVLMYDAPVAAPEMTKAGTPVDMYFIRLSDDKTMSGTIDGFDKFEISTRFGKVSMPMDQVAGIKFHTDSSDSAVVVLNNGDSITGVPTIPAIQLKTDWGQADIEPKSIESLTTTANAKFVQENSDFGSRWTLKTGNSFAPGAMRN